MAPVTTKSGISVLDSAFGGLYLKRATLIMGRRKSGKSILAAHFVAKTLQSGENVVIFTAKTPMEVTTMLDNRGVDTKRAIEGGQLVVCPYSAMKRSGDGPFAPLPFPEASEELAKLVIDNSISYAIFDSVVPWTAIEPLEKMEDHAEDFVGSLEALKLTSLLLLPNAASPAAHSLTDTLRELCPTNIELESKHFGAEFVLRVTKYQGVTNIELPWEKTLNMIPGEGFAAPEDGEAQMAAELAARQSTPTPAEKRTKSPKFRPLIQSGPSDFGGEASAGARTHAFPPPSTVGRNEARYSKETRFKPLVASSADVFAATQAGTQSAGTLASSPALDGGRHEAPAPKGRPDAVPRPGTGQKPGFASVIDISDFSSDARLSPPSAPKMRSAAATTAQDQRPAPVRVSLQAARSSLLKPGFGFGIPQPVPSAPPAQNGGNAKAQPSKSDRPKTSFSKVIG